MKTLQELRAALELHKPNGPINAIFFKTDPGQYAEHEQFIGVSVPVLRKIAKQYQELPLETIQELILSPINEERQLALFILVYRYQKAALTEKNQIYQFYLSNLSQVNNWNLVDASAHLILGAHLLHADKSKLLELSESPILWERRVAIVATWYFIRNNQYEFTLLIAEKLLTDQEDLIHKAVGWMLREMGKKDQTVLVDFLAKHSQKMPRTMLRYAIERFPEEQRQQYLKK